jgi:hypothetical protein
MPTATTQGMLPNLLPMPGEQDVSFTVLAGVADQRKRQTILVRSAKLVNAAALAAFRSFTGAAGALDCNGVPADRVGTPDITRTIMIPIDIKCAIGPHSPYSAERVSPRAGERSGSGTGSRCTGSYQRDQCPCEDYSKGGMYFHGGNPALR